MPTAALQETRSLLYKQQLLELPSYVHCGTWINQVPQDSNTQSICAIVILSGNMQPSLLTRPISDERISEHCICERQENFLRLGWWLAEGAEGGGDWLFVLLLVAMCQVWILEGGVQKSAENSKLKYGSTTSKVLKRVNRLTQQSKTVTHLIKYPRGKHEKCGTADGDIVIQNHTTYTRTQPTPGREECSL
ncbi:hypothetical protein HYFRA_00010951 [Hymenoscyphus fraxineus]|uniref:Uncharacterized protein n=1 Tax=Hymenoscyphus fraxineus TaxID=746836 RepID=A0A9N9PQE3_9HELO|nr:hypothetical protein HYFRA_00010951 [Hymenoscyphus fraxineus]